MASFNIMGGGLKLPELEFGLLMSGNNTISCGVGDFVAVEDWNQSTPYKDTIVSGGVWVDNTKIIGLIRCTSTSLVINRSTADGVNWYTVIKQPKTIFTTVTVITTGTQYTNLPKDAMVYANFWSGPKQVNKFTNIAFYGSGTPISGFNFNPMVGYVIDDTNDLKLTDKDGYLSAAYFS